MQGLLFMSFDKANQVRIDRRQTWFLVLLLLVGTWSSGCKSVVDYKGSTLPQDLRAKAEITNYDIDLATLASHSIDEDLIYPGDVLEVTVTTGLEETQPLSWSLRVSEIGEIDAPLVGTVNLAGRTLAEAEYTLREASIERDVFRQPHVAVLMKNRQMIKVRVVGAVKAPGVYELPAAGSDLLAAIVAADGLSEEAGKEVEIRHPNGRRTLSNDASHTGVALASFESSPETPQRMVIVDLTAPDQNGVDLHVEDGSVVMVKEQESHSISVLGLVKRPGNYDLPLDETYRLLDAVAMAGGTTVSIADKVRVIRRLDQDSVPFVIEVSIKAAKHTSDENLVLMPGDTVSIEETPATFVVETVRSFVRFGFSSAIPAF